MDYTYDALDRRTGETLSQNGLVQRSQTNVYNNQGWLAGVSADARFDAGGGASLSQQLAVSYQFDASGNRVQVSNAPAGSAAAEIGSYSYDASGRMLSGRDDKRNEVVNSLSYDGFGNRISGKPGVTESLAESMGSGLAFILSPPFFHTARWEI